MALAAAVALTVVAATAWAYWSAGSVPGSNGAAAAANVSQGATPVASASGSTVSVSWTATTLTNGLPVSGYLVKRYDATTSAVQAVLPGCAGTLVATSCVENGVPDGVWRYTVTPVFATNWRGAESLKSATVSTDVTSPVAPALTGISSDTGSSATDRVTSAASQTLTGTSEAGSSVTVRRGTTVLGTVNANGSGVFTLGPVTLTLGTNTFTATATDAAGNTSVASSGFVVTLDTVEPFSVVISPSSSAWRSTGAWSITADDALSGIHHVSYKIDAAGYVDLPATNGVAISPPSLADGVHTVFAYASDVAGKDTSALPVNATIRVDSVAPTVNVVLNQTPNAEGWRSSGQVTVTGADATSGVDHVEYKVDGAPTYTSIASGAGFVLADGTHSVTARTVDAAGNVGDAVTVSGIKVDSSAPATTGVASSQTPNANGWVKVNTVLTFTPTDATPGSGIRNLQYRTRVDGGAWSGYTTLGVAPYTLAVTTEGTTDVELFATDVAGNLESPARSYTVKLDKTNPSISSAAPVSSTTVWRSSNQMTITGGDAGGSGVAYVEYRLGTSGPYTQVGSGVAFTLPQGTNAVYFHAVDAAGNAGADNATAHTVLVDTTAPTLTNPVPAGNMTSSAWANIDCESGSFANRVCVDVGDTGGSGLNPSSVTFRLVRTSGSQCWNGSAFVAGTGCAAQAMTLVSGAQFRSGGSALSGMTDGAYSVTFAASDNAGNAVAPLTTTFTVENTPPTGTITNPSSSAYTVAGCGTAAAWDMCGTAADAGSGVDRVEIELRHNGILLTADRCLASSGGWSTACGTHLTATLDASGNWSYVTGTLPGDGILAYNGYTLTVYVYDRAGNLTTLTRSFSTP
jgi:hypothetical protein